jgi:hypothetical protein
MYANSYFYFSVDPGQHHLCSGWAPLELSPEPQSAAYEFTAVAGTTHYFRVKDIYWRESTRTDIKLAQVNGDEAQLLMSRFAYSTFQKK